MSTFNGQINTISQQAAHYALPRFASQVVKAMEEGLPNKLLHSRYNDFAPRLGMAWRPFGGNKTVLRAGAGIFYLLTNVSLESGGSASVNQGSVDRGRLRG